MIREVMPSWGGGSVASGTVVGSMGLAGVAAGG
jgi:hypothetical protein